MRNNNWKKLDSSEWFAQETPIDRNDITKTRWDTIYMTSTTKKTILYPPNEYGDVFNTLYISAYKVYLKKLKPYVSNMNESMKKEYLDSKNKFDSLLPPKNIFDIDKKILPKYRIRNLPREVIIGFPQEVQKVINNPSFKY